MQKVALITGANKGIGFGIAHKLGKEGVTVLVGARNENRGEDAVKKLKDNDIDAHFLHLDVTLSDTIKAAANWIDKTFGKLDILVNNAGIALGHGTTPSTTPVDVVRKTYETNVFGVIQVTNAMLPLIRKSGDGRIVNVSSGLGSLTMISDPESPLANHPPNLGYCTSKTALNAVTLMYAKELSETGIKVNAVSPGFISTDLNGHRGTGTIEEGAEEPVRLALLEADGPTGKFFNQNDSTLPW